MKQSLARITAWAKKHPWLAALIVGGVILLGYLVYKRSGNGGGSSGETFAELPESSADVSPIPGMGDIPSPVTGGGSSSTSSDDLDLSTETGQASPASFPSFETIPPAGAGAFSTANGSLGWMAPDLGETVAASFNPAPSLPEVKSDTRSLTKITKVEGGGMLGTKQQPEGVRPNRIDTRSNRTAKAIQTGYKDAIGRPITPPSSAVVKKATPTTKPGRTPAERLGLYWLYSGTYNGVRYALGYPVGSVPTGITGGSVKITPTGRAARR